MGLYFSFFDGSSFFFFFFKKKELILVQDLVRISFSSSGKVFSWKEWLIELAKKSKSTCADSFNIVASIDLLGEDF